MGDCAASDVICSMLEGDGEVGAADTFHLQWATKMNAGCQEYLSKEGL